MHCVSFALRPLSLARSKRDSPLLRNNLRSTFAATASSQTSALVTYVDVRFHLHKPFDTCGLPVFNSPTHCSPFVPDYTRQHEFQRAQQALTRRER